MFSEVSLDTTKCGPEVTVLWAGRPREGGRRKANKLTSRRPQTKWCRRLYVKKGQAAQRRAGKTSFLSSSMSDGGTDG